MRVVAFLDTSPVARSVLTTAETFAGMLGADLDALHAHDRHGPPLAAGAPPARVVEGTPEAVVRAELERPDVVLGVFGARSIESKPDVLGHLVRPLVVGASHAIVIVPPGARPLVTESPRILLPLDGEAPTSEAAGAFATGLVASHAEIITLHVFDSSTVPMFFSSENQRVFGDEFLARHAAECSSSVRLRLGEPGAEILAVIDDEDADVVMIAWHGDLRPGHADVVRRLLRDAPVPVILQPIERRPSGPR